MKKIIFIFTIIISNFFIISSVDAASYVYSCEEGYTVSGTKCKKEYKATWDDLSASYYCETGDILNAYTNICVSTKDAILIEKSEEEAAKDGDTVMTDGDANEAGGCPLGEDVTKDLSGALKIMKIVAPLLMIAYTIMDTVKAVANGKIQEESKKLYQRLCKRLVYTIILFFIPVIIDQVFQIADVWNANGECDFNEITSLDNEQE